MPIANGTYQLEVTPSEHLQNRLNDPQVAEALNSIIDNIELVAFSITALDGFLRRGDEIAESVATGLAEVKATMPSTENINLTDLTASVSQLKKTALKLKTVLDSEEFDALTSSHIFAPEMIGFISEAGTAMLESYDELKRRKPKPLGFFALLRTFKDPEVQWTLNFLIGFARRFSQKVNA